MSYWPKSLEIAGREICEFMGWRHNFMLNKRRLNLIEETPKYVDEHVERSKWQNDIIDRVRFSFRRHRIRQYGSPVPPSKNDICRCIFKVIVNIKHWVKSFFNVFEAEHHLAGSPEGSLYTLAHSSISCTVDVKTIFGIIDAIFLKALCC